MSTRFIRHGLLFFGLAAASGGCLEPPEFDYKPEIKSPTIVSYPAFDDFSQIRKDSVVITIQFQDGDGDLGVSAEERGDTVKNYKGWGNYQLKTFRFVNGRFEEVPLDVNSRLFFPRLKRDDKKSPLEGKLDFAQSFPYSRGYRMTPVKFSIKIRDRSLKESNTIETDTISIPLVN
ncbi:hypothetical protein [Larkinella soli]|uniref:hypothetical protein n=1 Tax=Larkinella soli TaxID=1770527 RepID=UPI000FFBB0BF|nr:hypothetical protein [Larkinella soli]